MDHRKWHSSYPESMPKEIDQSDNSTLSDIVRRGLAAHPERPAVTCCGETISYAELENYACALAAYLQSVGIQKGDRVALMMPNCIAYPVALVAVILAGFVAVNVNPLYTPRELEYQLTDAKVRCVIIATPMLGSLEKANSVESLAHVVLAPIKGFLAELDKELNAHAPPLKASPLSRVRLTSFSDAIRAGVGLLLAPVKIEPADIAFLQYTGGTTGVSKGAILTHRNMASNVTQMRTWFVTVLPMDGISIVNPLPLYHVYPLAMALIAIDFGANHRLIQNPRDTISVIDELRREPFDLFIAVNTLLNSLVEAPEFALVKFSEGALVMGAGASIQAAVTQRWTALGAPPITEAYGLTETSPSVSFNPRGLSGSIGIPMPSTDVLIVDEDERPVAHGAAGELLIKGPQVFAGYWNRDDETKKAFTKDGWFKTGDIVRMNHAGSMYIVDRKKDMILVSGFNVYPNEIEAVAALHPDIVECACVGVADVRSGEAPHLFVVRRSAELEKEQVLAHCRSNLTAYKVPKHVTFLQSLPKSPVGKILRRELRTSLPAATTADGT